MSLIRLPDWCLRHQKRHVESQHQQQININIITTSMQWVCKQATWTTEMCCAFLLHFIGICFATGDLRPLLCAGFVSKHPCRELSIGSCGADSLCFMVDTTFYYAKQFHWTNGWQNLLSITINYLNLNKLGNLGCIKKQHLIPLTERERREGVDYS